MIKFVDIHPDLVEVLKSEGIEEKDLFNYRSDLYVGCKTYGKAMIIKNKGVWKSCSSIFKPQEGSDMSKYPIALDITFGAMQHDFNQKHPQQELKIEREQNKNQKLKV